MPAFNLIEQTTESYLAVGDITFTCLGKRTMSSFDFLKSKKKVSIDLENITLADSAGLALVIEWIKYSQKYSTGLLLKNIPHQLIRLAKLSDFDLEPYIADSSV